MKKESLYLTKLILVSFSLILFLYGCQEDYYDPSQSEGSGSLLFEDGVTVPADFDWLATNGINLSVTTDNTYGGNYYYTIGVYDMNPLLDEGAKSLDGGVAKAGESFVSKVVVPIGTSVLYVQQIDPAGRKSVTSVEVSGSSLSVDFNKKSLTAKAEKSLNTVNVLKAENVKATAPTIPSDAIVIDNSVSTFFITADNNKRMNYVIKAGVNYTGTLTFNTGWGKGVSFYIEGTWTNANSEASIGNSSSLYILHNGKVDIKRLSANGSSEFYNYGTINSQTLDFTNNSVFRNYETIEIAGEVKFSSNVSMLNDGQITFGSLSITDRFNFENNGTLIANSATISNGSLINNGTVELSSFTSSTESTIIENNATLNIKSGSFTNATLKANCHTVVETMTTDGAKIEIANGALLSVTNVTSKGTTYSLSSASILKVSNLAKFESGNKIIGLAGDIAALAKLTKVESGWLGITYSGNLETESSDHVANGQYSKYYELKAPATLVGAGQSSVKIPSTACNDGGNNYQDKTPNLIVFPVIYAGAGLTYLFEDNWPYLGDFDMNDLVLDVVPTYAVNSENKVTKLTLDVTLRAIGASRQLAVALQLDGVSKDAVRSVSRSNSSGVTGLVFNQNNGLESGQTYAVLPLFDDAHLALGNSKRIMMNTVKGSENNATPLTVTVSVEFVNPIAKESIGPDVLNVFVVNGGYTSKRQEIHMPGFEPTDKMNTTKYGFADDNSLTGTKFTSKNNLIWGLALPASSVYPNEWTSIRLAFPNLESWVVSKGVENLDWYKSYEETKIY